MSSYPDEEVECRASDSPDQRMRNLWASVLHEQLKAALDISWTGQGKNLRKADQWRAIGWMGSKDFYMVCALAGLDGDYILDGILPILAAQKTAALKTKKRRAA
jgi:hypothetical protein